MGVGLDRVDRRQGADPQAPFVFADVPQIRQCLQVHQEAGFTDAVFQDGDQIRPTGDGLRPRCLEGGQGRCHVRRVDVLEVFHECNS